MTITKLHTHSETDDCLFCMEHLEEAAMRTLEPEIQQRMEGHLARCQMCRSELSQIENSLQLLAYAVKVVEPRTDAKTSLIARYEAERDQPPLPRSASPAQKPRTNFRPSGPRYMPWSYGGMFAGLAVAVLIIGMWSFLPLQQSTGELPRGQIQVMAMKTTCEDCDLETGGQIGADPLEKDGLVVAWNLDPERKHEVWCVNRDGQHTKVGDLKVTESGSVLQKVSFPDAVGGYQQIYVIRDDGAQELSFAPGVSNADVDEPSSEPSPPMD